MKQAVTRVPVTVKIRLGWNDEMRNHLDQARAAVDGGADALFVHGRTRNARYRHAADWDAIGEIAAAVPVPVVGNGDLLFPHEIADARARAGCRRRDGRARGADQALALPRGQDGYRTSSAEERVAIYRRYVTLAREHWGADDHGLARVRMFVRWHLDFWHRYVPQHADGSFPRLQAREPLSFARTPLEHLLARTDPAAHDTLLMRSPTSARSTTNLKVCRHRLKVCRPLLRACRHTTRSLQRPRAASVPRCQRC